MFWLLTALYIVSCVPRAEAQRYKSTCSFAGLKGPLPRTEVRGFHREAHPRPDLKKTPQSAQPRECASTAAKTHRRRRCGSKFVAQQDPHPSQNLPFPGKRPGVTAAAFRYPSFQLPKNLPQAVGPWGHSFYVLSVTYRKRKFKMVLSKCCQKFHSRHSRRRALAKGGPGSGALKCPQGLKPNLCEP